MMAVGNRGGRPSKPAAVKKAQGNPGRRPVKEAVAPRKAVGVETRCPAFLGGKGKRLWRKLAPELEELGLLSVLDGPLLGMLCQKYEDWRDAVSLIRRCGISVKAPSGYEQVNPAVAVERASLQAFRQLAAEFGLSPASRARLGTTEKDAADALTGFLQQVAAEREERVKKGKGKPDLKVVGGKKK